MFDEESKVILSASVAFWNETESVLKQSEQLRGELVMPAVSELRYAGRKLVDFSLSRLNDEDMAISKKHIYDYEQCCVRARHDAVDAAVMYMKTYYMHMIRQFGIDVIHDAYDHHAELRHAITVVEERVLISRAERHKRIDLYAEINEKNLTDLIEKFSELVDSEEIVKGLREAKDKEHRVSVGALWFGVLGFVAAIGFGIFSIFHH